MSTKSGNRVMLFAAVLAGSVVVLPAYSQSSPATEKPAAATTSTSVSAQNRFLSNRFSMREQMYYEGVWGVDSLKLKYTESGEMIRFSYRVLDPAKAAQLNDKKAEPYLYDPQFGVKLKVPQMQNIGRLRQSSTPIAGKTYWMAFSNSGRRVRPGHRVSVEIGQFHAINLLVE